MIAHLRGRVLWTEPGICVLDCGGVGYQVAVSIPTYSALPTPGAEASLHIYTQVREDILALFGFADAGEKRLFERLITVAGVGPKLALTILSGLPAPETIAAIRAGDHARLQKTPGVGKRLAERLAVELKDKLEDLHWGAPTPVLGAKTTPAAEDVLSALINLGYQRAAAQKALEAALAREPDGDFDRLFRASLGLVR